MFLDCLLQILTCSEVTLLSYRLFKIIIIVVVVESISCVRLFLTPWMVALPGFWLPWDFPNKEILEWVAHSLLQKSS